MGIVDISQDFLWRIYIYISVYHPLTVVLWCVNAEVKCRLVPLPLTHQAVTDYVLLRVSRRYRSNTPDILRVGGGSTSGGESTHSDELADRAAIARRLESVKLKAATSLSNHSMVARGTGSPPVVTATKRPVGGSLSSSQSGLSIRSSGASSIGHHGDSPHAFRRLTSATTTATTDSTTDSITAQLLQPQESEDEAAGVCSDRPITSAQSRSTTFSSVTSDDRTATTASGGVDGAVVHDQQLMEVPQVSVARPIKSLCYSLD